MRKIHLILALGFLILWAAGCTNQQPEISLLSTLELGDVVNGEIVVREVTVSNVGDAPLAVEAVTSSCGCTTVSLDPMTISPGGSGVLHVEFDSGAHGPEEMGEMIRQVFIASNDPEVPEFVMEIRANILPPSVP